MGGEQPSRWPPCLPGHRRERPPLPLGGRAGRLCLFRPEAAVPASTLTRSGFRPTPPRFPLELPASTEPCRRKRQSGIPGGSRLLLLPIPGEQATVGPARRLMRGRSTVAAKAQAASWEGPAFTDRTRFHARATPGRSAGRRRFARTTAAVLPVPGRSRPRTRGRRPLQFVPYPRTGPTGADTNRYGR